MTEYLTITETATPLRRKAWPVRRAIERGDVPAFQPSGEGPWLIRPGGPARLRGAGGELTLDNTEPPTPELPGEGFWGAPECGRRTYGVLSSS